MSDNLLAYGWLGLGLVTWLGLSVGSFLNVVIYRLPVMLNRQWQEDAVAFLEAPTEPPVPPTHASDSTLPAVATDQPGEPFNLVVPRSRCPRCGHAITAIENIPVISWIVLGGRCRACRDPIPMRYPLVETLTALLTLLVIGCYGYTWIGLAALGFTWTLVALTFIDFDTQLLPDQLTLPLLWLGLLINAVSGGWVTPTHAIVGASAGYLSLWSVYWAFKLATGKEGMGYGDFKLLAAIGAWFGWQVLPALLLIAAGSGLGYTLVLSIAGRRSAGAPVPFGPFLAIAGFSALLARDPLTGFIIGI